MYFQIIFVLLVIVAAYIITKRRFSVEISMLVSAVVGGVAGIFFSTPPVGELARHLVEGSTTYLDVILIFVTATIFMDIIKESGGISYLVQVIIRRFYTRRIIALLLLMIIILIPGALTGAGSVSLLVVGAPVALALGYLGIPRVRVAAILFIIAGLSAAAPPVNIWAMIVCAGTAIPYVGFELPLLLPVLGLGAFTILFLGWKGTPEKLETILADMPELPAGLTWWRVVLPFAVFFGLVLAARIWPFQTPILGLPLEFTIAAAAALLVSPVKMNILEISRQTVKKLTPLLATVVVVGIIQQVITVSGVRGLLSYVVIGTPLTLLFITLAFIIPISEGVLTYGGAAVFGIPITWYFNSVGLHPTVVIAGLSLLWPLGDGLPPTALIGRLSAMVSDYRESYWSFMKKTWVPWLVITLVAMAMIIYSGQLSFLVIG